MRRSIKLRRWIALSAATMLFSAVELDAQQPSQRRQASKSESVSAQQAAGPEIPPEATAIKPIQDIPLNIAVTGEVPANVVVPSRPGDTGPLTSTAETRGWADTLFFWQASNMVHKPLYFEQKYVERYGYNFRRWQPVASGVQFYTDVALLPGKLIAAPPCKCVFSLGYQRPGSSGTPCPRH